MSQSEDWVTKAYQAEKQSESQICTLSHHSSGTILTDAKTGDSLETGKDFHKYLQVIWAVANNASLWTIANRDAGFYAKQFWILSF